MKKNRLAYAVEKCFKNSNMVSDAAIADLQPFQELLETLTKTASKKTHYDNLDKWSEQVFKYIHKMLKKYRFKNGGLEQPVDARFWWNVYDIASSCVYSPNLETQVATHHASAFERNESLKKDIKQLQELLQNR